MSFRNDGDAPIRAARPSRLRRGTRGSHRGRLVPMLAGLGLLLGCASASPPATAPEAAKGGARLDDAPVWVVRGCRAYWTDPAQRRRTVCGVGSAPRHRNTVAARETAIARARAEHARSLRVTIERVVRLEDAGDGAGELETIVHQLASASLRGVQLEAVWSQPGGETHALVSLDVDRVRESVRSSRAVEPIRRADLAERAAAAFAAMDAAFEAETGR